MGKMISTLVKMPESLYYKIKQMAEEANLDMEEMLVRLLDDSLRQDSPQLDAKDEESPSSSNDHL